MLETTLTELNRFAGDSSLVEGVVAGTLYQLSKEIKVPREVLTDRLDKQLRFILDCGVTLKELERKIARCS